MAPRFAPDALSSVAPFDTTSISSTRDASSTGLVAALASRRQSARRGRQLDVDEFRRLDDAIGAAVRSTGPLPTLKQVAAAMQISRGRLRRAIGSIDDAVEAYVDERISTARRCSCMPSRWYPALAELSADIVMHRLYVQRIIADVIPDGHRRRSTAALLDGLASMLDDDLAYNIRRLGVFDDPAEVRAFVADAGALLSFRRLHELGAMFGDDRQLEHRLNVELHVDMTRHRMFEFWADRRHDWFAVGPDERPAAS